MVKILYFITDLDIGGAEQLLFLTLKNLNRQKYKPTVCCLYGGELVREIEKLDIEVIDLNTRSKFDLRSLFKLRNLFKKEKFDIVHTHLFHANVVGRIVAYVCRVPIVISTLHYAFSYNGKFGIFLERFTSRLADRIIVVSNAVKKFCINEIGISEDRLQLIYNGIDIDIIKNSLSYSPTLKEQMSLNNHFIIGCIGRFEEVKGHRYLLQAVAETMKNYSRIKVLLVGSGSLKSNLKKMANELGISEATIFLDKRRDIVQILDSIDLYVMPSLQEGLSITLLEALAMGKPVIATAVGGNPEVIVDGESGLLIPAKDYRALSGAIISLLNNRQKAKQLGLKAMERVSKEFDIKKAVQKIESLYELIIDEKQ